MATKKGYTKEKIQDFDNSGFKKYDEDVGGGGSPNPSKPGTHGHGVNSDYRAENNDTMQPRTNDGKFTYKSVNGKSIDPKYGKSRGKTVNPLLTGGENGVMIKDVEDQFYNKSGNYWDKYKDKWYTEGGEIVTTDLKTRVAADSIWNVAKRIYNEVTGEFGGAITGTTEDHNGKQISGSVGDKEEHTTFDEVKKGKPSAEEKLAKQQVQATGEEKYVIDQSTGGIKVKKGRGLQAPAPQPQPTPAQPTPTTPIIPPNGGGQPVVGTNGVTFSAGSAYTPKYSADEIADAEKQLQALDASISFEGLSPEEIDEIIDEAFPKDDNNNNVDTENNETEENVETEKADIEEEPDSDAIKKIKKMGFYGE